MLKSKRLGFRNFDPNLFRLRLFLGVFKRDVDFMKCYYINFNISFNA